MSSLEEQRRKKLHVETMSYIMHKIHLSKVIYSLSNIYLALMSRMNIHNESRMHVVEVGPQSMPDGFMRVVT